MRGKYIEGFIKENGALRLLIEKNGYQEFKISCKLENIKDKYEIENCNKALNEVEKYFRRNKNYKVKIERRKNETIFFILNFEIKNWNRVFSNITSILNKKLNKSLSKIMVFGEIEYNSFGENKYHY